jgi:hypothetical protein
MGIGNLIIALASLIDQRTPQKPNFLHTSWQLVLLLLHLNLFWHVLDIFEREEWLFLEFLYIVSGAAIIYFATSVLLPDESSSNKADVRAHFLHIKRQFFGFLALLQIWVIGFDLIMGFGITNAGIVNFAGFIYFIIMSSISNESGLRYGTIVAWFLFVILFSARAAGLLT